LFIAAPLIGIIILAILAIALRNVEPEKRSLETILENPLMPFFAAGLVFSLASFAYSQTTEHSVEMGFPLVFATYYPYPQNSEVTVTWLDTIIQWAINPLEFSLNAGFYTLLLYLSTVYHTKPLSIII